MTHSTDLHEARPSRRAVVRTAAWTVPVVAVATTAPAYAASPCDPIVRTIDWGNNVQYSRTSATSATYTVPDPDGTGPGEALVLTISNTSIGSNTQLGPQGIQSTTNDNLRVFTGAMGGSPATTSHLTLHQSPINNANKSNSLTNANRSITRFSFSRPVANLGFTLRDIDSTANDFWDAIAIVATASTSSGTPVNSATVIGTGATGSPWRAASANLAADGTSTAGNVTVNMTNVSAFDVYYWNITADSSSRIDGDQKVFFSSFDVTYKPCT